VALIHDALAQVVIGCAIRVHKHLGPGLLESTYRRCMTLELDAHDIRFVQECPVPLTYRGVTLDCAYRVDLLIEERLVVELKAVEQLLSVHSAQVLTYLKLLNVPQGLLINFNQPTLVSGLKSLVVTPKENM